MARVVMFVLNDVRYDARVLREAATLAGAGHEVTVIGRPTDAASQIGEREARDGFEIVRVPVPGPFRRALLSAESRADRQDDHDRPQHRLAEAGTAQRSAAGRMLAAMLLTVVRLARGLARLPGLGAAVDGMDWLARWRLGAGAWAAAAAAAAPNADVWHGHDLPGLAAAVRAHRARGGRLVYDSHELFLDAGATARRPSWARSLVRRSERRWVGEADALVTVNDALASELARTYAPRRMVVVHNCPPRWSPSRPPPRWLRKAAALPPGVPLVLYHGSLAPHRGVEVLVAALAEPGLEKVHAVFLGTGPLPPTLLERAADPAHGGRIHVLDPVDPFTLPAWIAGADVGAIPIAPSTRNHLLSTPNKLFECLAAGVPVVVSDFPVMRAIVRDDPAGPLGEVCDPTSAVSLARALRAIIELSPSARVELRARCLASAHARWNWETESGRLLELYRDLGPAGASETASADPVPQRATFVLPSTGAFDSRTRRMAVGLGARGHDVLVIARAGEGLPAEERPARGVRIVRVSPVLRAGLPPPDPLAGAREPVPGSSERLPGPGPRGVRLAGEAFRVAGVALRARAQARAARTADRPADLYHAMGFLALPVTLPLARRANAPFVYDARDIYAGSRNIARLPWPLRRLFEARERAWARRAARVFTVNEACADVLHARFGGPRPAVVLNGQPSWSPPEPWPDLLRERLALTAETPIVLYHGAFMRDRGLPELLAAMRQPGLEGAHLVLLGAGPLEGQLAKMAADPALAGRVTILPPVPPEGLLPWVASADVGVMPNQPWTLNERLSTPNKLFESIAAGLPVVSSDFPERRRIVIDDPDGPLGAVCDPTDPADIAGAIRSILELDPAARSDLRLRCLRAARERYAWERQFPVVLTEYARLTGRPW